MSTPPDLRRMLAALLDPIRLQVFAAVAARTWPPQPGTTHRPHRPEWGR